MRTVLAGDIELIPGRRKGRYPHCNSLLIGGPERALIDPASDKKELSAVSGEGVSAVLLSHFHTDHMRYLGLFEDAPVYIHELESGALEDIEEVLKLVFYPDEPGQQKWRDRKLREIGGWGFKVDHALKDGEKLRFGGTEVEVIHAPGHTPGHCCFWFPQERLLYSADFDFTEFGPWYGNSSSSVDEFLDSIEKLKRLSPDITVTAHERGIIEGDITPRLDEFSRIIKERECRLLEHLSEPLTIMELAEKAVIYGEHFSTDNFTSDVERRMVRHHLESAAGRGLVRIEGEKYVRA